MRKLNLNTFLVLLLFSVTFSGICQENADTTAPKKKDNKPRTASIMSACFPGLGQIYNKKYWKLPIIYGGFAGIYYFHRLNNTEYKNYKAAYMYAYGDTSVALTSEIYALLNKYPIESLNTGKDYYKSNTDMLKLIGVALYLLNIVDASVDAHLRDFEIDDNLTLSLKPSCNQYYTGVSLALKFK